MENDRSSPEALNQIVPPDGQPSVRIGPEVSAASDEGQNRTSKLEQMVQTILRQGSSDSKAGDSSSPTYSFGNAARLVLNGIRVDYHPADVEGSISSSPDKPDKATAGRGEALCAALQAVADCKNFKQNEFRELARSAAIIIRENNAELARLWKTMTAIEALPRTSGKNNAETLDLMAMSARNALTERFVAEDMPASVPTKTAKSRSPNR